MLEPVSSVLKALAQAAALPSQINPSLSPSCGSEHSRTVEKAQHLTTAEHGPLGMENGGTDRSRLRAHTVG